MVRYIYISRNSTALSSEELIAAELEAVAKEDSTEDTDD